MAIPGYDDSFSQQQDCPSRNDPSKKCGDPPEPCKNISDTSIYQEDAAQFNDANEMISSVKCNQINIKDAGVNVSDSQRLIDGCKIFKHWMGTKPDAWRGKSLFRFIPVKCPSHFVTYIEDSLKGNDYKSQEEARGKLFNTSADKTIYGNLPKEWRDSEN